MGLDKETYIQLDRIEAKLDYIIKIMEEDEKLPNEEDEIKIPQVKTSIKNKKSEIIDEEENE